MPVCKRNGAGDRRLRSVAAWLIGWVLGALSLQAGSADVEWMPGHLRLNEVQYIGTHNSYHIAMGDALAILLKAVKYDAGDGWDAEGLVYSTDYTHPAITTQLDMGLRQFELDVYADPEGGRFAAANIVRLLGATPWNLPFSQAGLADLNAPGFKVLHNPEYDLRSTNYRLTGCLQEMVDWSRHHPGHLPIIVQLEVKDNGAPPVTEDSEPAVVLKFDHKLWLDLEVEIRSVIPAHLIITPDLVRGESLTLREAIRANGWPTLDELKGKFLFFLLNKKPQTDSYMEVSGDLTHRLFFASLNASDPSASWFRVPDPSFTGLSEYVRQGFLATTMADQHTRNAREMDYTQRDKAFTSGAQFILTDFPVPDRRFSDYHVVFENSKWVRPNPLTIRPDR